MKIINLFAVAYSMKTNYNFDKINSEKDDPTSNNDYFLDKDHVKQIARRFFSDVIRINDFKTNLSNEELYKANGLFADLVSAFLTKEQLEKDNYDLKYFDFVESLALKTYRTILTLSNYESSIVTPETLPRTKFTFKEFLQNAFTINNDISINGLPEIKVDQEKINEGLKKYHSCCCGISEMMSNDCGIQSPEIIEECHSKDTFKEIEIPSKEYLNSLPDYDSLFSGNRMYGLIKNTCKYLNINVRRLPLETRFDEIKMLCMSRIDSRSQKIGLGRIIREFEKSKQEGNNIKNPLGADLKDNSKSNKKETLRKNGKNLKREVNLAGVDNIEKTDDCEGKLTNECKLKPFKSANLDMSKFNPEANNVFTLQDIDMSELMKQLESAGFRSANQISNQFGNQHLISERSADMETTTNQGPLLKFKRENLQNIEKTDDCEGKLTNDCKLKPFKSANLDMSKFDPEANNVFTMKDIDMSELMKQLESAGFRSADQISTQFGNQHLISERSASMGTIANQGPSAAFLIILFGVSTFLLGSFGISWFRKKKEKSNKKEKNDRN